MSDAAAVLHCFAFGEHLEGAHRRSLGYRLLTPSENEDWSAEVESLARRLQAAPYPDHWPPTGLFCSVLLGSGRRLVALARYGLVDHTPSQRRGGLELIGVIGPGALDVPSALAVYRWLCERRAQTEDLRSLSGRRPLAEVLATAPRTSAPADPVPVLPIRLWRDGALLFAATGPADPDHHLALLEQGASGAWQWLPHVGPDFPFHVYVQRGPLLAWTPHLAGVAVKLDRPSAAEPIRRSAGGRLVGAGMMLLLALAVANLWATWAASRKEPANPPPNNPQREASLPAPAASGITAERFAHALNRLARQQGEALEWSPTEINRLFETLAAGNPDLHLTGPEEKAAVVVVGVLSRRSAARIDALIRKALTNKGYDPRLIDLACQQVRQELEAGNPTEK
jgi:hypothetical protein